MKTSEHQVAFMLQFTIHLQQRVNQRIMLMFLEFKTQFYTF